MNFQESTTILNDCAKTVWKLIEGTTYMPHIIENHVRFYDNAGIILITSTFAISINRTDAKAYNKLAASSAEGVSTSLKIMDVLGMIQNSIWC